MKYTVKGALSHGFFINNAVFSSFDITSGGIIIPGTAIPIREGIT